MIGLIVPSNIKYAPYVNYYVKKLEEEKVPYQIISWNRRGIKEEVDFTFEKKVLDSERLAVLCGYFQFTMYVKSIIKKQRYSKIIIFTAAMGVFLNHFLYKKFKDKYILDIRDDSPLIHKAKVSFEKVCNNAYSVCVSSIAYSEWSPKDVTICHNADSSTILKHIDDEINLKGGKIKNIVFAGMLIEGPINLDLLKNFSNDEEIVFGYIGTDNNQKKEIKRFAEKYGIKNVFFEGTYNKDDIIDIYREKASYVNIIRKKSKVNSQAVPNKMYDAVIAGRPIIVLKHNKVVADYVEEYSLGVVLEELEAQYVREKLHEFERKIISTGMYSIGRKNFLKKVLLDDEEYKDMMKNFVSRG